MYNVAEFKYKDGVIMPMLGIMTLKGLVYVLEHKECEFVWGGVLLQAFEQNEMEFIKIRT